MSNKIQIFLIVVGIMLISGFVHYKNNSISEQITNTEPVKILSSDKTFTKITFVTKNGTFVVSRILSKRSHNWRHFKEGKTVWILGNKVIIKNTFNNYLDYKIIS